MRPLVALLVLMLRIDSQVECQILNAGFEERSKDSKVRSRNWDSFDVPVTAQLDSTTKHAGRYSMKVTGGKGMKAVSQKVTFQADAFEQLSLNAYIKTDSIKGKVGLLAVVTGPTGHQSYVNGSEGLEITKSTDWTQFTIPVIVEPGQNSIFIGGIVYGEGVAWFDDFQLTSSGKNEKSDWAVDQEIARYVGEFVSVIRKNALNFGSIDQGKFETAMAALTREAIVKEDCYPAFRYGIKLLNDGHSQFFPPAAAAAWSSEKGQTKIEFPKGYMIDRVACLEVPAFQGVNKTDQQLYADSLQMIIRKLDHEKPKGWIVDLRKNTGGNCWPMLAGLGPLIKDETCGYFFSNGKYSDPWKYSKGSSRLGNEIYCTVSKPYKVANKDCRLVVLQSGKTVSSGELVVISFKGRPKTVVMGTPSGGLTTNNGQFKLSDGAVVNLTTAIYADRNKKHYPSGIAPDIQLLPDDDAIREAIGWIKID